MGAKLWVVEVDETVKGGEVSLYGGGVVWGEKVGEVGGNKRLKAQGGLFLIVVVQDDKSSTDGIQPLPVH